MGTRLLRKIQIGKETPDKGVAADATAVLLGELTMKSAPTIHVPREERGTLASETRSVKTANLANLTFKGDATFEQILYWLHMGVLGNFSPTSYGDAQMWTFAPALDEANDFDSFTLEYGDEVQGYETEYCMASKIVLSGVMNEPLKVSVDIFGRKESTCSFTADSLEAPPVESILTNKAKLYIDNENGVMGYNEVAATLISFELTINTGLRPNRYADGSIDFSSYFEGAKSVELRATFAFNANAKAERALFDGVTLRLIRIEAEGSAIVGASPAMKKALTLDVCGRYEDFSTLEEREDEDVVSVVLKSQLGPNYGGIFEIVVVNDVPTLP